MKMERPSTDLWRLSAREIARAISSGEVSSREVIEAHLDRIDEVNPRVNAVVRVMSEDALAAADEADRVKSKGGSLGPLHGVPFSVKENVDMAGLPTTWGIPALAGAVPPVDAPTVEKMRRAGAIPIARTNLPDMALRPSTDSTLYGLTLNPWHQDRTAGGSSGGEAVALATGMTPLGIGTDIGGSLRNPANACGVVSVRPSAGRVPNAQHIPNPDQLLVMQLMNVQGPLARTVDDARLALQTLLGSHPMDPWSIDAPFEGQALRAPIRVAVMDRLPGAQLEPAVADAVRHAADALANAGYDVIDACPPRYEEAIEVWGRLVVGDFRSEAEKLVPLLGEDARIYFEGFAAAVPGFANAYEMSAMLQRRDGIARDWSLFQVTHPLILGPTWTRVTPGHGYDIAGSEAAPALSVIQPVLPANLLGLPSVCVPSTIDAASGLPIGVLVGGRRFREDLCLEAAAVIEAASAVSTPIDPAF